MPKPIYLAGMARNRYLPILRGKVAFGHLSDVGRTIRRQRGEAMTPYSDEVEKVADVIQSIIVTERPNAVTLARAHLSELRRIAGPLVEALEIVRRAYPRSYRHPLDVVDEALASPLLVELGITEKT